MLSWSNSNTSENNATMSSSKDDARPRLHDVRQARLMLGIADGMTGPQIRIRLRQVVNEVRANAVAYGEQVRNFAPLEHAFPDEYDIIQDAEQALVRCVEIGSVPEHGTAAGPGGVNRVIVRLAAAIQEAQIAGDIALRAIEKMAGGPPAATRNVVQDLLQQADLAPEERRQLEAMLGAGGAAAGR